MGCRTAKPQDAGRPCHAQHSFILVACTARPPPLHHHPDHPHPIASTPPSTHLAHSARPSASPPQAPTAAASPYPIPVFTMAAKMQQGGRPGGSRFAQFKLVLLGRQLHGTVVGTCIANYLQESPPSERCVDRYQGSLERANMFCSRHLCCALSK